MTNKKTSGRVALLINCSTYANIPGLLSSSVEKGAFLLKVGFDKIFSPEINDKTNITKTIKEFLIAVKGYKTRFVWIAGKFGEPGGAYLLPTDVMQMIPNPNTINKIGLDEGIDIYPIFSGLERDVFGGEPLKENYFIIESGYRFGNNQFSSPSSIIQSGYMAPAASINLGNLPANSVLLHIDGVASARAADLGTKSRSYVSILNDVFDAKKSLYKMFYETAEIFNKAGLKDLQEKYKKFTKDHALTAGLALFDKREGKIPRQVFSADMRNRF